MMSREGAGRLPGEKQEPGIGTPAAARLFHPGTIRRLFNAVKDALTRDAPAPDVKRKRREGTGRAFRMTARNVFRRVVRIPTETYARATAYLTETLDWLHQWHHYDEHSSEDVKPAAMDDLYPRP